MAIKLGEVCKYESGRSLSKNNNETLSDWISSIPTRFPLIKTSNIKNNFLEKDFFFIKENDVSKLSFVKSHKGDLLFVLDADVGSCCFNDYGELILTAGIIKLFPDETKLLKSYLRYYIRKHLDELIGMANGTTIKHLSRSNLEKWEINIPSLQTQQSIINIIEPFEKLNELIKQKVNNVDFIFQNIINNVKTKIKLSNLVSINAGQSPPQISKYWKNGNVPFVNINDLTNNMYVLSSTNFISELAYNEYRCKPTTDFSILVGKVSPNKNKISVIDSGFVANGAIRILEPINKKDYGEIFEALRNKAYILSKIACGSVQQQINSSQLCNLEINFDSTLNELFNKQLKYKKINLKIIKILNHIIEKIIKLHVI